MPEGWLLRGGTSAMPEGWLLGGGTLASFASSKTRALAARNSMGTKPRCRSSTASYEPLRTTGAAPNEAAAAPTPSRTETTP